MCHFILGTEHFPGGLRNTLLKHAIKRNEMGHWTDVTLSCLGWGKVVFFCSGIFPAYSKDSLENPIFSRGQPCISAEHYLIAGLSNTAQTEPDTRLHIAVVRCLASMVRQHICCRACSNLAFVFFLFPPMVIVLCIIHGCWQTTPALINKAVPPRLLCSLADASHSERFLNASGTSPGTLFL